jgi:hypothetical protein
MNRTASTMLGILVIIAVWAMVGFGLLFALWAAGTEATGGEKPNWRVLTIAIIYLLSAPFSIALFIRRASRKASEEADQETQDRIGVLRVTPRKPKQQGDQP